MRGGQKHKGIAQKKDISEDHGKVLVLKLKRPKTHPSLTFLTIMSDFVYFSNTFPKISDITFDSGQFGRSYVENGVRMQKLWPVEVCRQKLPKQRDRGGVAGSAPMSPPFFN
jgi:hypothetical protein